MTDSVIKTKHLTRRFGNIVAVSELDLTIPKGCVYGFLGPNGAGKTTTIRLLLGLIKANKGTIRIFGDNINGNRIRILRNVGSMVESPSLYPNLTGRENLLFYTHLLGVEKAEIDHTLDLVNLQQAGDRLVRGYSSGMRQRLGLGVALLGHPSLLILDEPTNGLDPAGISEMRQLLRGLPGAFGVTIFLSSHLLSEIELIATQIGIINHGKLIFQGSPEKLQEKLGGNAILQVDHPDHAYQILTSLGWQVTHQVDHSLSIISRDRESLALANTQLIERGIKVYHLNQEKRSLEDIFLSLTSEER